MRVHWIQEIFENSNLFDCNTDIEVPNINLFDCNTDIVVPNINSKKKQKSKVRNNQGRNPIDLYVWATSEALGKSQSVLLLISKIVYDHPQFFQPSNCLKILASCKCCYFWVWWFQFSIPGWWDALNVQTDNGNKEQISKVEISKLIFFFCFSFKRIKEVLCNNVGLLSEAVELANWPISIY